MENTTTRLAWTIAEAASATGMSIAFFKKIISKGDLAVTKAGARTLIRDEDLRGWLNKRLQVRTPAETGNSQKQEAA